MPEQWFDPDHNIVEGKSEKQKRPVIVALETDSGESIVSKPKLYIVPGDAVDIDVIYNPVVVIPEKLVV